MDRGIALVLCLLDPIFTHQKLHVSRFCLLIMLKRGGEREEKKGHQQKDRRQNLPCGRFGRQLSQFRLQNEDFVDW